MTRTPTKFTIKAFQMTAISLALALTGCGGSDSDTVDSIAPEPDTGVVNDGGSGDKEIGAVNIASANILDLDGNTTNTVGLDGAYYQVQVTDNSGIGIAGAKVSFSIDAAGVTLSQSTSGSVLTNSDGVAQVFLKPDNAGVTGAYSVSAEATFGDTSTSQSKTFSVQPTNIELGSITIEADSLPSGGQTSGSMVVTDSDGNALSGTIVNLSASCGQVPSQVTSDVDGSIQFVYKAINEDGSLCSGTVRLSASSGTVTQNKTLTVQAAEATSIIYTSNELTLGIKNSGSSSTGQVQFTVFSDTTPLANTEVKLSLEKSPLGLTFGPYKNREDFIAMTDEKGVVSVNLYPGSTPGPVEVKASLVADASINALSKNISVASARVSQNGLSLSWGANVLDWSLDGASTSITARMVDRNGNAVPDGTVINFTAEGGKVTSSCATSDGECSVTFSTQNPRPGDGRLSVLAVAEGEKQYIDMNENNAWDKNTDVFVHNIGDTFRDDNENNKFDIGEFTYPLTTQASGVCENNLDKFIQLTFPVATQNNSSQHKRNYISDFVSPNKANTCNDDLDAVIRNQAITLLSNGEQATFTIADPSFVIDGRRLNNDPSFRAKSSQTIDLEDGNVVFRINSGGFYSLNPMPSGTQITGQGIDNTDYEGSEDCTAEWSSGVNAVPSNVAIGEPGDNLGTFTGFSIKGCEPGDEFKVITTTPSGYVNFVVYAL